MADYSKLTVEEIQHRARLGMDWVAYWHLGDSGRAKMTPLQLDQEQLLKEKLREAGYDL